MMGSPCGGITEKWEVEVDPSEGCKALGACSRTLAHTRSFTEFHALYPMSMKTVRDGCCRTLLLL